MNLVRVHPFFAGLYDPAADALDLALVDDGTLLLPVIRQQLGKEASSVLDQWLQRDEATCWVIRDAEGNVLGGAVVLTLTRVIGEDFDPAMCAVAEHLHALGRGERSVIVHRAFIGPDTDMPGPVIQRCHDVCNMQHHAMEGAFRDSFLMYRHAEAWGPLEESVNFQRGPSFVLDGQSYGVYHRSFDDGSLDWFEKVLTELSRHGGDVPKSA